MKNERAMATSGSPDLHHTDPHHTDPHHTDLHHTDPTTDYWELWELWDKLLITNY